MKKVAGLLNNYKIMAAIQAVLFLTFWTTCTSQVFPSFPSVLMALGKLWNDGLLHEIFTSMRLYLTSLGLATILSLVISGLTAAPKVGEIEVGNIFKPVAEFIAKWRYFSMIGVPHILTLLTPNMWWMKVTLLMLGIAPWMIMGLNNVLESTPKKNMDYARTLRLSELRVALEVKIWGNKDKAIEVFRQTAAMGLMMLTMAELIVKDAGGISVILAGDEKFHVPANIFAVQIFVLLAIGMAQDFIIRLVRAVWCPYAVLLEDNK